MKKSIRNILLGIITFLSFLGFIKAEQVDKDFTYGTTMYIGDGYKDISCPNNLTYFDVVKVNDIYKVSLKSMDNIPTSLTEKLVCEYLKKSANSNLSYEKANVTFELNYKLMDRENTYNFTMTKTDFNSEAARDFGAPGELGDIKKVISFDVISGGENVNVECPVGSSSCIIRLKKDFYADNEKEFKATLVYEDIYGAKVTMHLNGTLRGKSTLELIPGNYGTCSFGSEWTNNDGKYTMDYKGGNIVLPACTSSGSADKAVEFYGWTDGTLYNSASNVCSSGNVYYAGESFNPAEKGVYRLYSCYVRKSGIIIYTNGAVVDVDTNNWIPLGKDSYFILAEEKAVLPQVTSVPAIYGSGAKFLGWQLNGTTTILPSLSTVEANRSSYHAIFETVSSYDSTNDYEFNYMYEGDTQVFSVNGVKFDSCSSNNSFVKAEFINGVCNITALKESNDQIVEVRATSSSQSYTLKLKILSKGTSTSSKSSSETYEPYVVSFDYLVAGDKHDGTSNGGTSSKDDEQTKPETGKEITKSKSADVSLTSKDSFCNEYYVNKTTPLADGSNRYFAVSTLSGVAGFKMGMPKFVAKEQCGENKTYDTICLDPSGTAPKAGDENSTLDGIPYYKVDFPSAEFEKAASVITGELISRKYKTNQDELLAANMALRIIAYDLGQSNVYNQEQLGTSYVINHLLYSGFAKSMRKELNDKKDITLNDSKYGYPASWTEDNIRKLVVKYLKLYYTPSSSAKDTSIKDFTFDLLEASFVETEKGVGTFSGKLKVPSDFSDVRYAIVATPEFKDGSISYVDGSIKFEQDGSFSFTVKYSDPSVLDKKGAIKFKLTFATESGRLKVALLKPHEEFKAAHYQRMIIFDDDNSDSSVYLEFTAKGGGKKDDDEDEDEPNICDLSLNELLKDQEKLKKFNESDCCQFITDQNSEVYQKLCLDKQECLKNTFALACDPDTIGKKDIYQVSEGYVRNGDNYTEKYDVCILDVRVGEAARKHTDQITDAVGNKISLDSYANNKYCRVSCKEDWDFSFSAFNNFTGDYAIKAGSYFEVDDGIFIGGARTCVTTYIDVDDYVSEVDELSSDMVNSYNDYALYSTVKNVLAKSAVVTRFGPYYDYDYDSSNIQYACPTDGIGNLTVNGINYNVGDSSCTNGKIEVVKVMNKQQKDGVTVSVDSSSSNVPSDLRKYKQYGAKAGDYSFNTKYTYTNQCINLDIPNGSWYSKEIIDKIKNECFEGKETVEDIVGKFSYNGKRIDDTIVSSKKVARDSKSELEKSAKDMSACQNFYLNNNTKIENNSFNVGETELTKKQAYESGYAYKVVDDKSISNQSLKVNYQTIETKFAPFARFQYEEIEFMSVIGQENYLVTFDAKNKEMGLSVEDNNKCVDIDLDDSEDRKVGTSLCKNKIDTYSYKSRGNEDVYANSNAPSSNSGNVSDSVRNRNFILCQIGDNDYSVDYKSGQTDCANAVLYYYDVNYIKQSMKNSSFYKNYGTWYVQSGTDVKTYQPSMDDAISKFGGEKNYWSILSSYNTFPIAVTTRRNIYRYMYSFDNIGYFANNTSRVMTGTNKDAVADLGRIMGATNSIMLNNIHTCFYEVYEDICKCCGDPIDTALLEAGNYKVVTDQHLNDYCANNNCNKSDVKTKSTKGNLEFYPSTVSLYDLDSVLGDTAFSNLGKNWSEASSFIVGGNTYTTDKGSKLANQIQSVGENIYDDTPEYSFYLKPEALSKIKEYNKGNSYSINIDNLIPYGYYKVSSDKSNDFDVNDENAEVTLIHYGSKFLEDLVGFVPTDYLNKTFISRKNNNVCYVLSTDKDAASTAYKMVKGSNCRWVDYVQYDEKTSNYFRLAYK